MLDFSQLFIFSLSHESPLGSVLWYICNDRLRKLQAVIQKIGNFQITLINSH